MKNTLAFLAGVILAVSVSTFATISEYSSDERQKFMLHYIMTRQVFFPGESVDHSELKASVLANGLQLMGYDLNNF